MIELSNSTAQTLTPGQSILFDVTKVQTGCGECHRRGSGLIQLRCHGLYEVSFGANIAAITAGTVQLALRFDGEALPESTAQSTPSTVGTFNSVSRSGIIIDTRCCPTGTVTLTNTGVNNVSVAANAVITVRRIG